MPKYKPGDKIRCIRVKNSDNHYFKPNNIYTIAPNRRSSDYGIVEVKELMYGWRQGFIENSTLFEPFIINWKKRIQK